MTLGKLSRSTWRDPMQTATLRKDYDRRLTKLFSNYKSAAIEALDMAKVSESISEGSSPISISWLSEYLERLKDTQIDNPGKQITSTATTNAFRSGVKFGERALGRIGISSKLGEGPADWRVIDTLQVRNLQALKGISAEMNKQIISELTDGINNGEGITKLRKRLSDRVDGIGKARAHMLAHTETMYASNQGALLRYSQVGIETVEWLTAGPSACDICRPRNGKRWRIDDPNRPAMPAHPFCLLPDTICETAGDIIAGLSVRYEGPVVEISIANGSKLTVTPNHMLLTPQGFIAAKLLRKGDNVIYRTGFEGIISNDPNNDNGPARIDEIVRSISESHCMAAVSVPHSPENLHGDGRFGDGDIDIVFSDRLLRNALKTTISEHVSSDDLNSAATTTIPLFGSRDLFPCLNALASAANGGMGGISQTAPLFRGRLPHPDIHRLTPIPGRDPVFVQDSTDHVAADFMLSGDGLDGHSGTKIVNDGMSIESNSILSENHFGSPEAAIDCSSPDVQLISDLLARHTGIVELQKVVGIKVSYFSGHVYDLQTESMLYFGSGILISNCRCVWIPVLDEEEEEEDMFEAVEDAQKWLETNEYMLPVVKISEREYRTDRQVYNHGQYADDHYHIRKIPN